MTRGWVVLAGALLLALPWNEAGDDPSGLALVHLLALGACLAAPWAPRPPLAGGFGAGWLAAFLAWGALGALREGNRFSAALEVWDQAVPALWLVAVAHAPLAAPARRRLAGALVAAASVHAAWALALRLAGGERTGGAFVNANFLAAHLNVALPVALWLLARRARAPCAPGAASQRSLYADGLLGAAALLLAAALFATGSRGGLLGTAAGLAVAVPWMRLAHSARVRPRVAALAAAALLAGIAAGGILWTRTRNLQADPFRFQRLQIWARSAGVWGEHFWRGAGPGQLQWIAPSRNFPLEERPFRYARVWTSAHSTPLQLAAEEGAAGLLLAGGFLVALGRSLRARASLLEGGAAGAALAALAAVGVHALVDTPLENTAVTLSLATLAGLALGPAAPGPRAEDAARGGRARPLAARAGPAGLAALAVIVWGAVLAPWMAHRCVLRFQAEPDARRALAALQRALRLNPYQHAYHFQMGRIAWTARGALDLRRVAAAERLLERASALNPNDGRADLERGRVMAQAALTGVLPPAPALRAALRRYEEASRRRRLDPIARQEAGLAALRLGDFARARAEAEAALALEPNFLDAHLLRADAALRAGARGEARAALAEFRAASGRLSGFAPSSDYEEVLLKYNDAVSGRLERELSR